MCTGIRLDLASPNPLSARLLPCLLEVSDDNDVSSDSFGADDDNDVSNEAIGDDDDNRGRVLVT